MSPIIHINSAINYLGSWFSPPHFTQFWKIILNDKMLKYFILLPTQIFKAITREPYILVHVYKKTVFSLYILLI